LPGAGRSTANRYITSLLCVAQVARPAAPDSDVALRVALGGRCPRAARRARAFKRAEFQKLEAKQQRRVPEQWRGPFQRLLTCELPELPDYERRNQLNHLRDAGTIRIEQREGEPPPFSVTVVNYKYSDVQALHPGEH